MLLGNLLRSEKKKYSKLNAKGLSFDSRTISKGDIFFAINGNRTSGNKFVKENAKVVPGQILVTSGIADIFPKNIAVGKIYKIIDNHIYVKPFVNFKNLEFVQVIKNKT